MVINNNNNTNNENANLIIYFKYIGLKILNNN